MKVGLVGIHHVERRATKVLEIFTIDPHHGNSTARAAHRGTLTTSKPLHRDGNDQGDMCAVCTSRERKPITINTTEGW